MDEYLLPGERLCKLERRGFRLIQKPGDGCFTQDSVLLADFAGAKARQKVCDLGAGDGALGMLLMAREPSITCAMVEIRPDLCERMLRSAALNGVAASTSVHCLDFTEAPKALGKGSYDLVVSNPPYHHVSPEPMTKSERMARQQLTCDVRSIAGIAAVLLRPRGRFCLCFPAARVLEGGEALRMHGMEPKRLRFVASFHTRAPYLCLMEGIKGAKRGLMVMKQLVQFDAPGQWTREMGIIYEGNGEPA